MTDRLRSFWIQKIWLEHINIIKKGFKLQNLRKKRQTQEAIICVSRYMPPELIFINPRKFNELVSTAAKNVFFCEIPENGANYSLNLAFANSWMPQSKPLSPN